MTNDTVRTTWKNAHRAARIAARRAIAPARRVARRLNGMRLNARSWALLESIRYEIAPAIAELRRRHDAEETLCPQ